MSIYRGRNKNEIYLASLLYDAIEDSDLRSVRTLLCTKGADPNLILPKKRISPFHLIIGNDSEFFALDVTRLILQNGGNPNIQADDGLTPLHIAAAWGRCSVLKALLDCGGNPEIYDSTHKTPLHYALQENFDDCYELLQSYVTDKSTVMCREKEDCINYDIKLDKIFVNNGATIGEYAICNEYTTNSIYKKELQKLETLPQSNSNDYVINWFNSHPDEGPKITMNSGISEDSADSLKESDEERHNSLNTNIFFRKVYRKKIKSPSKRRSSSIHTNSISMNSTHVKESSRESGITTLPNSFIENSKMLELDLSKAKDTTSDYATCTSGTSPDELERNIFNFSNLITSDNCTTKSSDNSIITKSEGVCSSDLSFVTMSEVYKYIDQEEGIVLFEKRCLKTPPLNDGNGSIKSFSTINSLPETIDYDDYDSNKLRQELNLLGYQPGPITVTTKKIYLKKLTQLKKFAPTSNSTTYCKPSKVFSNELEKTLKNPDWCKDISSYKTLDEAVVKQFTNLDPSRKWREGSNKSSFTYLLLDPRITNNLPSRADFLKPEELWESFLSAIFYVGKGKRSRPYSHLYDAVNLWNKGEHQSDNNKLNKILDIWKDGCGVVCLHIFQNTIPVEAYTREAAIIDALKIDNLCNAQKGNFYGVAATWTQKEKTKFGVFLLYKAMVIFLNEGERQLCPSDIN